VKVVESDAVAVTVEMSRDELRIVNNALSEVSRGPDAIEDWEFHARMGADRDKTIRLLAEVRDLLG
jgi:hypothetical protein